jgi:hypothetical protein
MSIGRCFARSRRPSQAGIFAAQLADPGVVGHHVGMPSLRTLLIGLVAAASLGGAAHAETLGACIWGKLPAGDRTKVLAAYQQSMAGGSQALDRLRAKLKIGAVKCGLHGDVSSDWVPTMVGSEAVQAYVASALKVPRPRLDAVWAAAPAKVATCIRANGRLAFYPNGTGCTDPAVSAWLLQRLGIDRNRQPAAQQAIWYFNAKAIGEWGDQLVAKLPPKSR